MRSQIDAVARRHELLTSQDTKALTVALRELSTRYNDESQRTPETRESSLHGARLQFSFSRDWPKSREALRELAHARLLPSRGPIRLLDLGAGLGATSLGVLVALHEAGFTGAVQITLVEPDAKALAIACDSIAALAPATMQVSVKARCETLASTRELAQRFDLVSFGQVLSEDRRELDADARVSHHVDLLSRALTQAVVPSGSLLVIEPALRTRTRHLHRVREGLLQRFAETRSDEYRPVVFAPCPHQGECGALARETDWCHEDRAVDLPAWLSPIARGAGLRWQGLTFSFLLLRRDGTTLRDAFGAGTARLVSELRKQKGKSECAVCTDPGRWHRLECLDRDAKGERGERWRNLARGDLIRVPREELDAGRLLADSELARVHGVEQG